MMARLTFLVVPLLASLVAQAAQLALSAPSYQVLSSDGSQLRSEQITDTNRQAKFVVLNSTETLKLSFQVTEKGTEKGVQPHQAFLRFYDKSTGEEGIQPVKVGPTGKAKFELNMAKPPPSLPPSGTAPLSVTLILGSFVHSPATIHLFDVQIPPSLPAPQHPEDASFYLLPEIKHTFRPEQTVPPTVVSGFFTLLVLAPWVVLIGLWTAVSPKVPHLFDLSIFPFTGTLVVIEALLFWYWTSLRLGQILLYGSAAGAVAVVTGKWALASMGERRLGRT
ncbi:uncharacterized protein STEHIDRAFT_93936 [Stereum hirsutum FP-91666 SS1]|uniref:uncharacterized protein n=1 Tax=Stereum hirsutum (strain FP-91666) TaxID=721885 RepID=UPI000440C046|nr:uncharacterized protein STEHIDRAFT_93936 [Stereum hirsutum FP-91666 SS1]EIM88923.1 hypothetical protein STEHIDRAFT_93936 [Stereum hirsutum FP-91666 SS1]